jgi:hypothetical protein
MRKLRTFTFTCENCGKEDQRTSRYAGPPRFCSKTCSNSWQHAQGTRRTYCADKTTEEWWREKLSPEEVEEKITLRSKKQSENMKGLTFEERLGHEKASMLIENLRRTYSEKYSEEKSTQLRANISEKCGWKNKSIEERFTPERAREIRKLAGSKNKGTKRNEETKRKMSESMHKRMVERPETMVGYGIKGWYRGLFFRSACEYFFMKKIEREGIDLVNDVDYEKFRIPYTLENETRTYVPDFYVKSRRKVYEVKREYVSGADNVVEAKKQAALDFFAPLGISYEVVQYSDLEIPECPSLKDLVESDNAVFLLKPGQSENDMLASMFHEQIKFMNFLQSKRGFREFPVDLKTKSGQKFVKDISHECMHEIFEAVHLLSDSKDHRTTVMEDFDKEKFLEEMADALHYYIEVCALVGITFDDLFRAFMKKSTINFWRIQTGY